MSQQDWLGYTGAIAGIVGAITGVVAVVIALLAFRRTGQLKALDLRLELRRTEATLRSEILNLPPLLEYAKKSRTRLAAAQGSYHSGATKHWLAAWEDDSAEAGRFTELAASLEGDCADLSQAQLEARLVAAHKLQGQVAQLAGKYGDSLAADDAGRSQLHADQRSAAETRLEGRQ